MWDFSKIDEAFERGYNQGYKHGMEDKVSLKGWNIPCLHPKHGESIIVLVKPYNKKTEKYCKKNNTKWLKYNSIYIDGKKLYEACDTKDPYSEEKYPNMALFNTNEGVVWDSVELWCSVEIPEWFLIKNEENEQ